MQRLLTHQGGVGCPLTGWGSQRVSVRNTVLTHLYPRIQRRCHQHGPHRHHDPYHQHDYKYPYRNTTTISRQYTPTMKIMNTVLIPQQRVHLLLVLLIYHFDMHLYDSICINSIRIVIAKDSYKRVLYILKCGIIFY